MPMRMGRGLPYEMTACSRGQQRMIREIITPIDRSSLKSTNGRVRYRHTKGKRGVGAICSGAAACPFLLI